MKLIHERTYCQIRERKKKSVKNYLFLPNSILSDVLSSKNKELVDLNIMDLKQMFDAEDLPVILNTFFKSGATDDILAWGNKAKKIVKLAVKTLNGMTEFETINNKVMQRDVLSQ